MINGIDLDGLQAAKAGITATPSAGLARYGVALDWQTGTRANVRTTPMSIGSEIIPRDFSWAVDEPPQLLGSSTGATPQELLMSGVGACIMVGFVVASSSMGVNIRSLSIEVTGGLDLAGFLELRPDARVKMDGLKYLIRVDCDASKEQLTEIEKRAVSLSPNAMSLAQGIPVSGSVQCGAV